MKNIFRVIILFAAVTVYACSSSDDDSKYGSGNDNFDLYGVGKWDNPEDFTLRKYSTLVDTIILKPLNLSVVIKTTSATETSVAWDIDGTIYGSLSFDDISNSSPDITISTFYPKLPDTFEYAGGMNVSATAKVGKNSIDRNASISEQNIERDVLCVNFGMDSLEVKYEIESLKGIGKFFMREDGVGYENTAAHFIKNGGGGKTLYLFDEEAGLYEVAEFPYPLFDGGEAGVRSSVSIIRESFIDFCERLGFTGEIILDDEGKLAGDIEYYQWDREGILFTIHSRDDVFPVETQEGTRTEEESEEEGQKKYLENSIGISYRLL